MALKLGTGAPTKKTVGAIGDVYRDTKTGNEYKCTFAYRSDDYSEFDCEWQYIGNSGKIEKAEKVEKTEEKVVNKEPIISEDATVKPKHKDYTSYGKKNK